MNWRTWIALINLSALVVGFISLMVIVWCIPVPPWWAVKVFITAFIVFIISHWLDD